MACRWPAWSVAAAVLRLFFPSRCFEAAGLEERVGDHRNQRVSVQTGPGSIFEVVEAEFLLELLMRLLTDPSGFDRGGERFEARVGRQVRHIIFLLARRPALADEPDVVARHALHTFIEHTVLMADRNAHPAGREEACQPAFRARRQLTFCHFSPANAASAETGGCLGIWHLRGFPAFAIGKTRATLAR